MEERIYEKLLVTFNTNRRYREGWIQRADMSLNPFYGDRN